MIRDIRLTIDRRPLRRLTLGVCGALIALTLPACLMELRPQSMGEITLVKGNVFLARTELMHPEPVIQAYPIFADDVIETQAQSGARISLPYGRLMLGPNTRLTIQQPAGHRHTIVWLERGTLRMKVPASDAEDVWTVEILAAGSSTAIHHGEVTVWVQEDVEGQVATEPGEVAIRSVGVINHGSHGEATFHAMGGSVVIRPGYLSATAPSHGGGQAICHRHRANNESGAHPEHDNGEAHTIAASCEANDRDDRTTRV